MAKKTMTNGNTATADKPAPAPRKNLAAETIPTVATVMVHPSKLRLVDKFQGRRKPISDAEVANLADMIRKEGQLQPVRARQVQGTDEYEVVFGNTRTRAGQMIVNGYTGPDGKTPIAPAPDFKMRVEVIECSDEDAFRAVVTENSARFKTSPIDDAYNQKRLREELGLSDVAIASYYGQAHSGMVNRLKKLIDPEKGLSNDLQNKVADGSLGIYAALDIMDATQRKDGESDKDAQTNIWLKAVDISGKDEAGVNRSDVTEAIKQWRKEVKEAAGSIVPLANQIMNPDGTPVTQPEGTVVPDASPRDANNNPGASEATPRRKQLTVKEYKNALEEVAKDAKCPANVAVVVNACLALIENQMDIATFGRTVAGVVLPDSGDPTANPADDTLGDYTKDDATVDTTA